MYAIWDTVAAEWTQTFLCVSNQSRMPKIAWSFSIFQNHTQPHASYETEGPSYGKVIKIESELAKKHICRERSWNGIPSKQVVWVCDCCQTRFVSAELFTAWKLSSYTHTGMNKQSLHTITSLFCPYFFFLFFAFSISISVVFISLLIFLFLSSSSPYIFCIFFLYLVFRNSRKCWLWVIYRSYHSSLLF